MLKAAGGMCGKGINRHSFIACVEIEISVIHTKKDVKELEYKSGVSK